MGLAYRRENPVFTSSPVFATFGQETIQEGPPTNIYGDSGFNSQLGIENWGSSLPYWLSSGSSRQYVEAQGSRDETARVQFESAVYPVSASNVETGWCFQARVRRSACIASSLYQ